MERAAFACKALILGALVVIVGVPARQAVAVGPDTGRPNIILILADDLGYETIGANGGTSYRTPRLDALAATGVRFERCYVQPLCTPTRVQLMTGQSNARNYLRFGVIDPNVTTFAHLFERAGYATGIVGKWQLGREPDLPHRLGFHEFYLWQHTRRPPRYANPGLEIMGVERDYNNGEYGPDLLHQFACDFISRHKDEPFLLYYPMTLTHAPYQPTPDSPDWDPHAVGEQVNHHPRHFGEMVEYMDKLIGKLVDHVESLGLRNRTLIIFLGDNGTGGGIRSKMGDREIVGGKGRTTDAGMHVPLIVNGPGLVQSGKVCDDLIDSTDIFPTICEAAGIPIPADLVLDGRSFWPQLCGKPGKPREWIYCWYSPRLSNDLTAIEFAFNKQFKLYKDGRFFDIVNDPGEKSPLNVNSLTGEAAPSYQVLLSVLKNHEGIRPPDLNEKAKAQFSAQNNAKPNRRQGRQKARQSAAAE
ncbi:MAG: sulfatase-like hydrolase/transferase [Thermogutta sp.]|uniref:sulfatase-like hydrolase/transferase n=1 Tax=Thermogutta sp. TaxID=1962930 RepID=UPI00198EE7B9|nr:sulfatase-like hydrolase/transferase [Thermogutta sp.]MBC7350823.1 sulfatase-like hydrolase/transferase [Thermogutta sp.]